MSLPLQELFDLRGQSALVTGGSRGLGLQIAEALGEAGASVLLTSRKADDLKAAASRLRAQGIEAAWVSADARDPAQVQRVVDKALAEFGKIDILVNNAGALWGSPAEDHPLDAWDKVMNLNVRGTFMFSQAVARASMIPRGRGRIVNVASIAGLGGNQAGMTSIAYNASKGAVLNFTRALAAEWGRYGITVNAIAPGFFPTKMTEGILQTWGVDRLASQAPLNRLGDDDDLKGAVVLFASRAGKHITGQMLAVDGGVTCISVG